MTPFRRTTIALDFDRTFTSDIEFWRLFIRAAVSRGHKIYCVTGRTECDRNKRELSSVFGDSTFSLLSGCIFCNHSSKRAKVDELNITIDIWIDDLPEGVGAPDPAVFRQLEAKFPVCETLPVFNPKAVDPNLVWRPTEDLFLPAIAQNSVKFNAQG